MNAGEFKLGSALFETDTSHTQKLSCHKDSSYLFDHAVKCRATRRSNLYLSLDSMQKMMGRFLTEKKMSKSELAGLLEINIRNLDNIFSGRIPPGLLPKVNLQLTRLYCSTKW